MVEMEQKEGKEEEGIHLWMRRSTSIGYRGRCYLSNLIPGFYYHMILLCLSPKLTTSKLSLVDAPISECSTISIAYRYPLITHLLSGCSKLDVIIRWQYTHLTDHPDHGPLLRDDEMRLGWLPTEHAATDGGRIT